MSTTNKDSFNTLIKDLYADHLAHGWPERTFGENIALIHSEVSEALEEYRDGHDPRLIYYKQDGLGYDKPEGIAIELADVFIRVAVLCAQEGIDLFEAVIVKMDYNKKRPARHGGKKI